MALKAKQLSAPVGADLLPQLMREAALPLEESERIPIDKIVPASKEWNFYAPLPDDKMLELIESIRENGLLHPIVVWKRKDAPPMVLSGHNRLEAYKKLYQATGDEQYAAIPCMVKTDLTPAQAQEIVVDSNWVQRTLTPSEKARSIRQKYALAGRKARAANGSEHTSTYDIIAQQYGLSGRQIARYVKLGSLQEDLLRLLDSGALSVAAGVKLADLPPHQQALAAQCVAQHGLKGVKLAACKSGISDEELKRLFQPEKPNQQYVTVQMEVPASLQQEFLHMAQHWLKERAGAP